MNFQRNGLSRKGCILFVILILIGFGQTFCPAFAEDSDSESAEKLAETVREKVKIVLEGKPVTEMPEEDRGFLFQAETLFPDEFNLFFRHGEYLGVEKKEYNEAIPRLKRALEIKPKSREVFEVLALCHEALKQTADQVRCWESLRDIVEMSSDTADLGFQERVFKSLSRLADENGKTLVKRDRFMVYVPQSMEWQFILDELSDPRLEEVFAQVTRDLDCIPDSRTSILVMTPEEFAAAKPTEWAGAFAEGKKSMTLPASLFSKSPPEEPLPCKKTVVHEFTHNLIHISAGGKCPAWLNEGMAVFEGSKNDTFFEYKPLAGKASSEAGELLSLADLDKLFSDIRSQAGGPEVKKAYFQAGLYARFLVEKFTLAGVRQILNGLKGNIPMETVLTEVTRLSMPEFETRFRKWSAEVLTSP